MHIGDNAFLYQFVPVQVAAKQFAQRGLLETAVTKYKEAIPILVGNGFEVPLPTVSGGGLYSEKYVEMPLFKRTALMQACNDIGQFFMKTGDDEEVGALPSRIMFVALNESCLIRPYAGFWRCP